MLTQRLVGTSKLLRRIHTGGMTVMHQQAASSLKLPSYFYTLPAASNPFMESNFSTPCSSASCMKPQLPLRQMISPLSELDFEVWPASPCSTKHFSVRISTAAIGRASASRLHGQQEIATPSTQVENPKAALLVIGNEILTGKIQDTNTTRLAKLLFSRGVDLVRLEVVPDLKEDIVESIRGLQKRVGGEDRGFVFTSGGIGPTHDDVTYEAVATACGTDLSLHEPTVERMRAHYEPQGKVLNEARLRMATLPTGCEVLWTPGMWVPLAVVKNVYVLPGIPRLFSAMLDAAKDRFTGALYCRRILYTTQGEGDLAEALSEVAKDFPAVAIGSYPATTKSAAYTTKLSFESRDEALVAEAVTAAKAHIAPFVDDAVDAS